MAVLTTDGPRFYPDDPLWIDDDTALDASAVVAIEDANSYDFAVNTFSTPGERRNVRALNVNTLDEVPDSSWFVNRMGREAMSTPMWCVDRIASSRSRSTGGSCRAARPPACSRDFG